MPEVVESGDKDLDELEEEFKESLKDAAEGRTSDDVEAIRERIARKRERSESDR
jgi:hypothetical protein